MKRATADCPHGAKDLPAPRRGLFSRALSSKDACEVCGVREDLRVCQTCGYVACCESHDAHDAVHFEASGHPFIRPRVGRAWLWCYLCRAYLE
jgi:uncharacterized UBP type Zn finger protein